MNLFRYFWLVPIFLIIQINCSAQNDTIDSSCNYDAVWLKEEINFMNYLVGQQEYKNVLTISDGLQRNCIHSPFQLDSINYLSGWAAYHLKRLEESSFHFSSVSTTSPFYYKSKFFEAFNQAYLNAPDRATEVLIKLDTSNNYEYEDLRQFELASIALLNRDYVLFDSLSTNFNYSNYTIQKEQATLLSYKSELQKIKKKSALLAACMSAVVPGSGKFYAGFKGQAIAAAIPTVLFGAVAAENLIRGGIESPQFIISAGLFSIFYVGNIWGSALSVKIYRDESYHEIDHSILLDMHIPLRRVFNN